MVVQVVGALKKDPQAGSLQGGAVEDYYLTTGRRRSTRSPLLTTRA